MIFIPSPAFLCAMPVANREFCDACSALDLSTITTVRKLIDVLDEQSKPLATDEALRFAIHPFDFVPILTDSESIWGVLSPTFGVTCGSCGAQCPPRTQAFLGTKTRAGKTTFERFA